MGSQIYSPFTYSPVDTRRGLSLGVDDARRDMMTEANQEQAMRELELIMKKRLLENKRYEAQTPAEISKSQYEGNLANARNNPAFIESVMRGERGEHQTKEATGRVDLGTADTRVAKGNAENNVAALANRLMEIRARTVAGDGLTTQADYNQTVSQMPDMMKRTASPYADVGSIDQAIESLSRTPQALGQDRNTRIGTTSNELIGRERNESNERIAGINAEARIEAAWARQGGSAAREKVESIIKQYLSIVMDGGTPTPAQDRAFKAAQQIQMNVRQAAGVPMDPNLMMWMMLQQNGALGQNAPAQPPGRPTPNPVDPGQVNPPRPAVPAPAGTNPQGGPHTLQQLRQMYPGRSDAELTAAYRKRFSVDPK